MKIVRGVDEVDNEFDEVFLMIGKDEVENRDFSPIRKYLSRFVDGDKTYKKRAKLNIGFDGYDDNPLDVWQIDDITEWVWLSVETEHIPWFYLLPTYDEAVSIRILVMCYFGNDKNNRKVLVDFEKMEKFITKNFKNMDNYFNGTLPDEINVEITKNVSNYIYSWLGIKK